MTAGLNPPWTSAIGVQYNFEVKTYASFVRVDWAYQSRNNWLSTLQDPRSSQYNPNTYALPANTFMQARAGIALGEWTAALFVDNLLNSSGPKLKLRFSVINLTNKEALYNFLSTFSGTHFVTPRAFQVQLGVAF